jgi:hypothetical protein
VANWTSLGSRTSGPTIGKSPYSALKFIKSKYRSVLADKHLAELLRTGLAADKPDCKKLTTYPELCYVILFLKLQHY